MYFFRKQLLLHKTKKLPRSYLFVLGVSRLFFLNFIYAVFEECFVRNLFNIPSECTCTDTWNYPYDFFFVFMPVFLFCTFAYLLLISVVIFATAYCICDCNRLSLGHQNYIADEILLPKCLSLLTTVRFVFIFFIEIQEKVCRNITTVTVLWSALYLRELRMSLILKSCYSHRNV